MTSNMREFFEQGYAAGYAACEAKMAAFTKIGGGLAIADTPRVYIKPASAPAAKTVATQAMPGGFPPGTFGPKAKVARGVKKPALPHSKGVKEGIVNFLGTAGMAPVPVMIAKLKFKESSIRATLMALKKKGIAASEKGMWSLTPDARQSGGYGNSGEETTQPPF